MPVQKQTRAGQRTRFKAFVVIGKEKKKKRKKDACARALSLSEEVRCFFLVLTFFLSFFPFNNIGDSNGHLGLGVKCSKEVATAIRGAIGLAKLAIVPVRRGYWGNKIGNPHTVPGKVTGKCGSTRVRLIPAPRGNQQQQEQQEQKTYR